MRQYDETQGQVLLRVVCNKCGKELKVENGILREGCFSARQVFGYFSRRDGISHRFDLCEDCYQQFVESFLLPVEETEENELL